MSTESETSKVVSVSELLSGHTSSVEQEAPQAALETATLELAEPTTPETATPELAEPTTPETPAINDDAVLAYLKEKGIEADSLDQLGKSSYDSVLSDSEKEYLEFKKQTGGSREDFAFQKKNWDEATPLELAKVKIKNESGLDLSDEEVRDYIEDTLGFDIRDEDLSVAEKVKLNSYLREIKKDLKSKQSYMPTDVQGGSEIVTLDNGIQMTRKQYNEQLKRHQEFQESNKDAVNSVTAYDFGLKVQGENGEVELKYSYDVSDSDRQSMLSMTNDVSDYVSKNYTTPEGSFKQAEFNRDIFWLDPKNRERAITSLLNSARAEAIEEVMAKGGNVNLSPNKPLSNTLPKDGVKVMSIKEIFG